MNVLAEIMQRKRAEVADARARVPIAHLESRLDDAPPVRDFAGALLAPPGPGLIAEIKRRSPSAGEIRPGLDPVAIAAAYREGGARCLSILTDGPSFGGSLDILRAVRATSPLPILRKEFIVDPYQVVEARVHGADAILLIASELDPADIAALAALAYDLGMDALVEVHDEADLQRVLDTGVRLPLLGINNRDLKAQRTDLAVFERLAPLAAPAAEALVAESGIRDRADVRRLAAAGAAALLVGESLLRQPDPAAAARALLTDP